MLQPIAKATARFPACIMGTCVVPWSHTYDFEEDLFRHQIRSILQKGTEHLYVFGTAGEGYGVTDRQFVEVVRVFDEEMRKGAAEPIVGVISLSLQSVIERIEIAVAFGIRRFQISLPSWGALSDAELFVFFREVCGRFRDCQFLHYNLQRTKRLVTPAEYARLADEHPNLVATKNSTDSLSRISSLLALAPQLQHFFGEAGYAFGSLMGECGLLISLASINWNAGKKFFDAGRRRDTAELMNGYRELAAMHECLLESVGDGDHIDGTYDKMLWRLHDPRFPLRLLPPYVGATEESFDRFASVLRKKFPGWVS